MEQEIIKLDNQSSKIEWTTYLATGCAEGFEMENASNEEKLEAWAVLIKTKLCYSLQGLFGRTARELIEDGIISKEGVIDWDKFKVLDEQ